MKRSKTSLFFITLAMVIAVSAVIVWVVRSREIRETAEAPAPAAQADAIPSDDGVIAGDGDGPQVEPGQRPTFQPHGEAAQLMAELAKALNDQDMDAVQRMLGSSVDAKTLARLNAMASSQKALGRPLKVREVGETELNRAARWAIEGGPEEQPSSIYLDLKRGPDGWQIEKVTLPDSDTATPAKSDSLMVAEAFLQAVLSQRFEEARKLVDGSKVSDARIAGLCIVFEEGHYHMRDNKPLRPLVQRETMAGYLANVEAADGSQAAQFALTLVRQGDPARWEVAEINLDRLLADYAQRVADGDVYYSPLVKNPKGGDTLALYFGFDEDGISPRTKRQLAIVAGILKADPVKKLTLSGHTDAKGSDDYNRGLSMRRAEVVRDFLIESGVHVQQVELLAMGASQPRRPNVTESGQDNPAGRKVNRRTEIYLDF